MGLGGIQLSFSSNGVVLPLSLVHIKPAPTKKHAPRSVGVHGSYKRILGLLIALTGGALVVVSLRDWDTLVEQHLLPAPPPTATEGADETIRTPVKSPSTNTYPRRPKRRRR